MILLWLNASANQIVEIIMFISDHYNVNMVLLSATLIAVGNSLQDYFANASMSRLGYGVMAVTGTVAGQLFNFLIGFGLNMVRGCWHNGGSVRFPLFGEAGERGGRGRGKGEGRGQGENVILDEGRKRNDSSIYSMIILLVVVAH